MNEVDLLKSQVADCAFNEDLDGCVVIDCGGGVAILPGKKTVAICSRELIGGTIVLPWTVVQRVLDEMPNKE